MAAIDCGETCNSVKRKNIFAAKGYKNKVWQAREIAIRNVWNICQNIKATVCFIT